MSKYNKVQTLTAANGLLYPQRISEASMRKADARAGSPVQFSRASCARNEVWIRCCRAAAEVGVARWKCRLLLVVGILDCLVRRSCGFVECLGLKHLSGWCVPAML